MTGEPEETWKDVNADMKAVLADLAYLKRKTGKLPTRIQALAFAAAIIAATAIVLAVAK